MTARPRVVVTDAEERAALAACRGLAAAGYDVTAVASRRPAVSHWSRAPKERVLLQDPRDDPAGYVESLEAILRRGSFDAVVPGSEASLLPISAGRASIEPLVRLGLPAHEEVLRALDKVLLHELAVEARLAPPPSVVCSSTDEAVDAARELGFPVVVKPARSFLAVGTSLRQENARVVQDRRGLEAAAASLGTPLTVQEFVSPEGLVSYAGVRSGDALLGLTVARYSRTFPVPMGSAAMAVTIQPPDKLTERVADLLGRIGWEGLFELELLDLGSGRYGAIDLNPRPFGWMSLPIAAGANLPAIWCDRLLERASVPTGPARVGVRYRWEDADLRHLLWQLRRGRLRRAAAVLRPYRRVVHAHFRLDDPGPLLARLLYMAQKSRHPGTRGSSVQRAWRALAASAYSRR